MAVDPVEAPAADAEVHPDVHPDLLIRFRQEYRGRHDPADALFWIDEPDRPGPSGAPAPSAAMFALRRLVYGPDATPADAARLTELQQRAERDSGEARRAVAVALTEASVTGAPPVPDGPSGGGSRSVRVRDALTRARLRVGAIAAGCAALGVGVGALIGVIEPGAGDGAAAPTTAGPVVTTVDPSVVLNAKGPATEVGVILSPQIVPSSVSVLLALDTDRPALFAARDRLGEVCLLVSREFVTAACVPPADFHRSGVTLQWTTDLTGPGRVVSWRPDGSITVRRTS